MSGGMLGLSSWMVLPAAFALDMILGDPRRLPHPVRWMGMAISYSEPFFRRLPLPAILSGGLFAVFLVGGTWAAAAVLMEASGRVHPWLPVVAETIMVYYCLSIRSLGDAALEIFQLLRQNRVSEARSAVAMIVGRDVEAYAGDDIARATVETVAENFVDGVLSPLFYAALGGAPLAMAFKMVSTLDSMVGYKNAKYIDFGKVAARLDDICNVAPARISIPLIALAAQFLARTGARAFKTALAEGAHHTSPNAGRPEAAFAGALGVKLNGPNRYSGVLVEKPYIGVRFGRTHIVDIPKACDLMTLSSVLGLVLAVGLAWLRLFEV
jgi:adenosylcobinamide-phosphate synthase